MKLILFLFVIINVSASPLLDRVKELDEKIFDVSNQINKSSSSIISLEKAIDSSNALIKKLKKENKVLEEMIKKRAKYLFKIINGRMFLSFADSDDALAIERKEKFLKIVINNDLKKIFKYLVKLRELNTLIKKSKKEVLDLKLVKENLLKQKLAFEKEKKEKKKFIQRINKSKKLKKKLKKEKNKSQKRISKKLKKGRAKSAFLSMKGRFDFPINAKVHKWYYVKYVKKAKSYDMHKGLTFKVPIGTRVHSIYKGSIVFASYIKGYGKTIIISHGAGYYTIYMHLNKINIKRGDEVKSGDIIALSGDTGSIEYPKLYFEIRKKKTPININKWFKTKK